MCRVAAPQNTRRALVATPVTPRPCSHAAMRLNRLYGIRDLWHRRLTRASRIGYVPICATRMLPARRDAAYGILTMCSRHPWYDAATRHFDARGPMMRGGIPMTVVGWREGVLFFEFLAVEDEVAAEVFFADDGVLGKFFGCALEEDFALKEEVGSVGDAECLLCVVVGD